MQFDHGLHGLQNVVQSSLPASVFDDHLPYPFTKRQNLDTIKLKAFADNKLNVAKMTILLFDRVVNPLWKKEKMLVTSIFSLSQCFSKSCSLGSSKVWIVLESSCTSCFSSLSNDKILDWSKLEAFADDKINVAENLKFV